MPLNFIYKGRGESSLTREELLEIISRFHCERVELKNENARLRGIIELYKAGSEPKPRESFDFLKDVFGGKK